MNQGARDANEESRFARQAGQQFDMLQALLRIEKLLKQIADNTQRVM